MTKAKTFPPGVRERVQRLVQDTAASVRHYGLRLSMALRLRQF